MPTVLATVKLYGHWRLPEIERELAREPLAVEAAEGATVLDLLGHLAEKFGPRFSGKVLRTTGEARPDVRVFIDDVQVDPAATLLRHGNTPARVSLVLLAPMAGG